MKTKNIYRIVMVLAGLVMLALAACGDLTGPGTGGEAIPEGMGLARINLGKGGARTALPDIGGSYYFTLEFTAPGKTAVSKTLNGGTSVTVALEPAFWNLEVRGYTDSGMTSLKVRGSAAAAVIAGTESRFDVDLTPDFSSGEKGSLVYSISFPASVSRGFLGLYPLDVPGYREEIGEIDVSLPVDRTGTITDLPEGSYRAVIELYDGEHNKAAAWTGAAHIYGGAATTLTRTFTAANFTGCPPVIGTGLTSLADKLDAALAAPLGSYTIVLDGNETDLESFNSKNLIATEDKAIIIRGNGNEVQLGGDGYLFNLNSWGSQMADLSLELHDLTLRGLESNSVCLVFVRNRGILKMRAGSLITGNSVSANTGCGGVYVDSGGTFTMSGGAVSGNSVSSSFSSSFYNTVGGGVAIISGTFIMSGGTISGNSVSYNGPSSESGGGGVCVFGGTFTMSGGAVSGNSAFVRSNTSHGGGVYVDYDGTFTMSGGAVNGNSVSSDYHESRGGGVYVGIGTFAMSGGTVSGNSSSQDGGGVYTAGAFTMSGGEVSGNSSQVGGGVHVGETRVSGGGYVAGTFSMSGGEISGNSSSFGSGVSVYNNGTFSMSDGTISGNTAEGNGGGVYVYNGTFSMNGGSVSGNILSGADSYGREVLVSYNGTFKMSENARPERVFLYDTTRFITISGPLSGGLTVIDLGVTTGAPLANWINAPVLQLDDSYSSGVLASLKDYFTLGNATLVHSPFTETALTGYEINDEGLFISK